MHSHNFSSETVLIPNSCHNSSDQSGNKVIFSNQWHRSDFKVGDTSWNNCGDEDDATQRQVGGIGCPEKGPLVCIVRVLAYVDVCTSKQSGPNALSAYKWDNFSIECVREFWSSLAIEVGYPLLKLSTSLTNNSQRSLFIQWVEHIRGHTDTYFDEKWLFSNKESTKASTILESYAFEREV